jgi:hypothetical protein
MNTTLHLLKAWSLGILLLSLSGRFATGEYPVGPPPLDSLNVQTTGGITYLTTSATLALCDWIQPGPVVPHSSTNLSMSLVEMIGDNCPMCIDCYYRCTNTAVLGCFPPGDYTLALQAIGEFDPIRMSTYLVTSFTVPAATGPTLAATHEPSQLLVQVNGIPGAIYELQASTTLTNWTKILTSDIAPFTFTNSTEAPFKFYRISISSGR